MRERVRGQREGNLCPQVLSLREREGRCLGHMTAKAATVGEGGKTFQTFVKRERGFGTRYVDVEMS